MEANPHLIFWYLLFLHPLKKSAKTLWFALLASPPSPRWKFENLLVKTVQFITEIISKGSKQEVWKDMILLIAIQSYL